MDEQKEKDYRFLADWNRELLKNLEHHPEDDGPDLMQRCSEYHYQSTNMEEFIKPYIGNPKGFIQFLSEEWGWIVTLDEKEHMITADENKEYCVCPMVRCMEGNKVSPLLCHCSEGFGRRMFGKVFGKEVKAEVVRSILRGDKSCVYRIWY